jgi:hypothetical protein
MTPDTTAPAMALDETSSPPPHESRPVWYRDRAVLGFGAMLVAFGVYCATHSVDFPVYHRTAAQIARGDYEIYPAAVYADGVVPAHGFRYAPAVAFLFVPFGWLPLGAAAFVFYALSIRCTVRMFSARWSCWSRSSSSRHG